MAKGTLTVRIIGDARSFSKTMDSVSGKVGRFGKTVARFGAAAASAGAAAAGALGVKATKAASDLEQSMGAVESVFGDARGAIDDFASTAASQFGLSRRAVNELASVSGAQLQSFGYSAEEAAETTVELQKRAADMAATFGGPVEDAVGAIGALMRGERDPIERFGVSIKQADINARLAAEGLDGLEGEERKLAEAQTALNLLMEQTSSTAGTFARESDTLAGKQARLKATFENVAASIGDALLPAASGGVDMLTELTEWLGPKIEQAAKAFARAVDRVASWWDSNGPAIVAQVQAVGQSVRTWWDGTALPAIRRVGDALREFWETKAKPAIAAFRGAVETNMPSIRLIVDSVGRMFTAVGGIIGDVMGAASDTVAQDGGNMEDTFGEIIRTVASLADSIARLLELLDRLGDYAGTIADIGRVTSGQSSGLSGLFNRAKDALGFRAHGGNVTRGPWLVGENGPEVVTMPGMGHVQPVGPARSGGAPVTVNATINMPAGSSGDDVVQALQRWVRVNGPLPVSTSA